MTTIKNNARKTTAVAAALKASETVAAKMTESAMAVAQMAALGFQLGLAESAVSSHADKLAKLHGGNRKIASVWFVYGYVAAYLLARHYPAAVAAAKQDGDGVFGEALSALGQHIVEQGISHDATTVAAGKYKRAEIEDRAYHAAKTKWSALEKAAALAKMTPEEREEAKKARKPKTAPRGKADKAEKRSAFKPIAKAKSALEGGQDFLELGKTVENLAKKDAGFISPALQSAAIAFAKAARENWEKVKAETETAA